MAYRWLRTTPEIGIRLEQVLRSWEGTRYLQGQRARRVAVDCYQLAGGIMDDLCRSPEPFILPRLQADAAMHNLKGGWRAYRALLTAPWRLRVVRDDTIEPGDILMVRGSPRGEEDKLNPGHMLVVTNTPWVAMHAVPILGVVRTSLGNTKGIIRVYRSERKKEWPLLPS